MENMEETVTRIRRNMERLARHLQAMEQENQVLKAQLDALRQQVADKSGHIEELKHQQQVLDAARQIGEQEEEEGADENRAELRKMINAYIREIDACIRRLEA